MPYFTGNANDNYKVGDLNVEASASVEDEEEDDVDWEEGWSGKENFIPQINMVMLPFFHLEGLNELR